VVQVQVVRVVVRHVPQSVVSVVLVVGVAVQVGVVVHVSRVAGVAGALGVLAAALGTAETR